MTHYWYRNFGTKSFQAMDCTDTDNQTKTKYNQEKYITVRHTNANGEKNVQKCTHKRSRP